MCVRTCLVCAYDTVCVCVYTVSVCDTVSVTILSVRRCVKKWIQFHLI